MEAKDNNASSSGIKKKQKTTEKELSSKESDMVNILVDRFWSVSDRKQKNILKENQIGPDNFHHWGKKNDILEKSTTLKKLVNNGSIKFIKNSKQTLDQILAELKVDYTIQDLSTFKKSDCAVAYDICSIPRWSFYSVGHTREDAVSMAAHRGLEFLIDLSL